MRYYVESGAAQATFNMNDTANAEDAVRAFFREYTELPESTVVKVYVLDFIGEFRQTRQVERIPTPPAITKPDSPHAIAHSAVPPAWR